MSAGQLERRLARLEAALGVGSELSREEAARLRELLSLVSDHALKEFAEFVTPPGARNVLFALSLGELKRIADGDSTWLSRDARTALAAPAGSLLTGLAMQEASLVASRSLAREVKLRSDIFAN